MIAFLANALWQPFLLAGAALAVNAACRRAPANIRYWIAIAALTGTLAMPIVSAIPGGGAGDGVARGADVGARTAQAITIVYLVAVGIAAIRLGRRWWAARRLTADTIATPVTIGVFRPVILLPRFLTDPELIAAAVAHETAHVRRRDYLTHLLIELVSLPLAIHPAVILLKRRITELREMACDAIAAAEHRTYPRALVAIATLARSHAATGALAMASSSSSIERRIASLRRPAHRASGLGALAAFAIVATVLFAVGCRNAVHPTVEQNLSGNWILDQKASRGAQLAAYRVFRQTITHKGDRLAVTQLRTTKDGTSRVKWSVTTDGVERPVDRRGRGRARWQDQRLVIEMRDPGQTERAAAFLENEALVVEGEVGTKIGKETYRAVFRRTP